MITKIIFSKPLELESITQRMTDEGKLEYVFLNVEEVTTVRKEDDKDYE